MAMPQVLTLVRLRGLSPKLTKAHQSSPELSKMGPQPSRRAMYLAGSAGSRDGWGALRGFASREAGFRVFGLDA